MTAGKYYYTDINAAHWMVKHYGVRVTGHEGSGKISVCKDSEHIFQPRVGDVVIDKGTTSLEVCGRIASVCETTVAIAVPERRNGKDYFFSNPALCKIIQRGGTTFFWPEVEA